MRVTETRTFYTSVPKGKTVLLDRGIKYFVVGRTKYYKVEDGIWDSNVAGLGRLGDDDFYSARIGF